MGTMMATNSRISEQLQFLLIDDETIAYCREFRKSLDAELENILDVFYNHVSSFPRLRQMVGDAQNIARLKRLQIQHWQTLFEGRFNETYVESITRIGHAHEKIGLEPQWYIASYTVALNAMVALAGRKYRFQCAKLSKMITAINKVVFLDMTCAISIYNDALQETANQKLNETVDEINGNIQTIATAIEELSASMKEVSINSNKGAEMAAELKSAADMTLGLVSNLSASAQEITNVVELIKGIASQTNLLALNATIEAASAGDAGRGFAVVANEVKELARQSASGGEEIRHNINAILSNMDNSVRSIDNISAIINEMNMVNNHIAAAIEEQSAVSNEIGNSILGVIEAAKRMQRRL